MGMYEYKLIQTMEGERFVLHDGDDPIGQPLTEVAVCFDQECGTLHKHGCTDMVSGWYLKTRKKLIDGGASDLADQLKVIAGPFPIEELNKILGITGYVKVFCAKQL